VAQAQRVDDEAAAASREDAGPFAAITSLAVRRTRDPLPDRVEISLAA
jgi:hypothetical protein